MDKIYDQAKDKNVAALVIYGKSGESSPAAYADSACTIKMTTSQLKDAFEKRAIINISGALYAPISFTVTSDIGSVTYAITSGSNDSAKTVLNTLAAVKD